MEMENTSRPVDVAYRGKFDGTPGSENKQVSCCCRKTFWLKRRQNVLLDETYTRWRARSIFWLLKFHTCKYMCYTRVLHNLW